MTGQINKVLYALGVKKRPIIPHGPAGIDQVGHRRYVGGMWDQIGQLQFDYLIGQGLQPDDVLLDIACGSLRAGRHFIAYLEAGNYQGIDKESELIAAGIAHELPEGMAEAKRPEFVVSGSFEFGRFSKRPTVALAQSLFTHLPAPVIRDCFWKLGCWMKPYNAFYATFFVTERETTNPPEGHDHALFYYTRDEIQSFAQSGGWYLDYISDWNHPRGQQMGKFTLT